MVTRAHERAKSVVRQCRMVAMAAPSDASGPPFEQRRWSFCCQRRCGASQPSRTADFDRMLREQAQTDLRWREATRWFMRMENSPTAAGPAT